MTVPRFWWLRDSSEKAVTEDAATQGLVVFPLVPAHGWGRRVPYTGRLDALRMAGEREGELYLRVCGWDPPEKEIDNPEETLSTSER